MQLSIFVHRHQSPKEISAFFQQDGGRGGRSNVKFLPILNKSYPTRPAKAKKSNSQQLLVEQSTHQNNQYLPTKFFKFTKLVSLQLDWPPKGNFNIITACAPESSVESWQSEYQGCYRVREN